MVFFLRVLSTGDVALLVRYVVRHGLGCDFIPDAMDLQKGQQAIAKVYCAGSHRISGDYDHMGRTYLSSGEAVIEETSTFRTNLFRAVIWLPAVLVSSLPAHGYPAYQAFSEKHSGRTVNCAMCHVNDNGPIGTGHGQIGGLTADQLEHLNKARAALEPGQQVDSPILNKFGNQIIKTIGRMKFIELGNDPGKLPQALGFKSDLDGDGIPDAQEFLDGTDPLNKFNGDPWKLLLINLGRNKLQVALAAIAIFCLGYGLAHLLKALSTMTEEKTS